MKIRSVLPAAAVLAAAVLGLPTAALAAGSDPAHLAALSNRDSAGKAIVYPVHPGDSVPIQAGVANVGNEPVRGVVMHLWIVQDMQVPHEFSNCLYYTDANATGAWCEFDQALAAGEKYELSPFHIAAAADAKAAPGALVIQVESKEFADSEGGVEALAKASAGLGTTVTAGTGGKTTLVSSDLPIPAEPNPTSFDYFKLILPSASPSVSTSPSASASPSHGQGTAATPTPSRSGGGGLPVTGSASATVAGAGAVLLAGGAAFFVMARRRRAKFVA